ncbi:MAG TPA: VCBS repeat-containing protein [Thermoanaerobaculia bacterium]
MTRPLVILTLFIHTPLCAGSSICIGYTLDAPISQRYRAVDAPYVASSRLRAEKRLTAADFDGDGRADVVAAGASGVDVLFGNGSGIFTGTVHALDDPVDDIAVGDFDGHGSPDIVVVASKAPANVVYLLRNQGGRTFGAPEELSPGVKASFVVAADFTNDRRLDLMLVGDVTRLLVNQGEGKFIESTPLDLKGTQSIAAGDFDGDGNADVVVARIFENTPSFTTYRGDGSGSFTVMETRRSNIVLVSAADVNGDGRDDVIAVAAGGLGFYMFTHGLKDEEMILSRARPQAITAADFNHDGRTDLAVLSATPTSSGATSIDAVRVFLGNGTDELEEAASAPISDVAVAMTAADFDRDGKIDLAIEAHYVYAAARAIRIYTRISVARGEGDGMFHTFLRLEGLPTQLFLSVAADLDGDGLDEVISGKPIISSGPWRTELFVTRNISTAGMVSETIASIPLYVLSLAAGDIDGDGHGEIAASGFTGVSLLRREADGTWKEHSRYVQDSHVEDAMFIEVDGDKRDELAFLTSFGPEPSRLVVVAPSRNGAVLFTALLSPAAYRLVSADVNGDRVADIVVSSRGTGSASPQLPPPKNGYVSLFIGRGDGTFEPERRLIDQETFDALFAGDFDGDGNADIVVRRFLESGMQILRGDGHGHFEEPQTISALGDPNVPGLMAYDLDGDGVLEIVASTPEGIRIVKLDRGMMSRGRDYAAKAGVPLVVRTTKNGLPSIVVDENHFGTFILLRGSCARGRAARH